MTTIKQQPISRRHGRVPLSLLSQRETGLISFSFIWPRTREYFGFTLDLCGGADYLQLLNLLSSYFDFQFCNSKSYNCSRQTHHAIVYEYYNNNNIKSYLLCLYNDRIRVAYTCVRARACITIICSIYVCVRARIYNHYL